MARVALIQWIWMSKKGMMLEYEVSTVSPTNPESPWRRTRSEYDQTVQLSCG